MKDEFFLRDWLVQPSLNRLTRGNETIRIAPKTMELLVCLAQRSGEVVTRQEILDTVWPDTFVEEAALSRSVSELRKILGYQAKTPAFVETIPKRGYRLVASVGSAPSRADRRWLVGAAAALLIAVLATIAVMVIHQRQRRPPRAGEPATITMIAVLPLRSAAGQPNDEFVIDGMTQMIITSLTRLGSTKVISFGSAIQYKASRKPLSQIAQELHADGVVQGMIFRRGDRVRVNVELIEARTGSNLWAGSYERSTADLLNLQDDVARAITTAIQPVLTHKPAKVPVRDGVSKEAYDAYLRGWYHLNHGTSEPAVRQAIEELQAATAAAPRFADAYAALAMAYFWMSEMWMPPRESMPKAKAAAMKALELDEQLASAHTSLGVVQAYYEWNWQSARAELQRAVELNPSDAAAHVEFGRYLGLMGEADAAVREVEIARDLDPLSLDVNRTLGIVYTQAGRYDDAIRQMKHRLEMDASPGAGRFHLGNAYAKKGMYAEALEQFDLIQPRDNPARISALGGLYAQMGRPAEAEAMLTQLKAMKRHRWVSSYSIAGLEAALGHRQRAIEALQVAYDERDEGLLHLMTDRDFDPLRGDPKFQQLMARIFPSTARR